MFSFLFLPAENLYYGIGLHFIPPPKKTNQNKTEETAQVEKKRTGVGFKNYQIEQYLTVMSLKNKKKISSKDLT